MHTERPTAQHPFRELDELLEAARFSLETARMALAIGRRSRSAFLTLDERLTSDDSEEREAGTVALEALDHARGAYLDLAEHFEHEDREHIALELRFWSTFEWVWFRIFCEPVRRTGQLALRHELVEATVRTLDLRADLSRVCGDPTPC